MPELFRKRKNKKQISIIYMTASKCVSSKYNKYQKFRIMWKCY